MRETVTDKKLLEQDHLEPAEAEAEEREGRSLVRDTRGLTTVEYIIILCLIAVVGFGVWKKFGEKVQAKVNDATGTVDDLQGDQESVDMPN